VARGGSRGPSAPQTPVGMTQKKMTQLSWGNRDNLTPNPFPRGKGNNRVCGWAIREVLVADTGRRNAVEIPSAGLRAGSSLRQDDTRIRRGYGAAAR
jgi:hypothetical protein